MPQEAKVLAAKAAIAPVATAIKVSGVDSESVRLTLDVYVENKDTVARIYEFAQKELIVTLQEA